MNLSDIQRILVDSRNWKAISPSIIAEMQAAKLVGVDIETNDDGRHAGLDRLMKVGDDRKKSSTAKLVFDTNRTVVTGFSLYADGSDKSYYVNLAHADIENRIPWADARLLLDAIPSDRAYKIAHNAPYELTMLKKSLSYDLGQNLICTLQLSVTAFNADTYDVNDFLGPGLAGIPKLFGTVNREFAGYEHGMPLTNEQSEVLYKVLAKESDADHSYNGYVKTLAYSHGLKKLTKKFLGYEQQTFEQVLNGKAHMGQLTGEEVCHYGADDAIVCVFLYHKLLEFIMRENPAVVETFFSQENPMIHIYSAVWGRGVRVDMDAILRRQVVARSIVASTLRTMKEQVKALLPFPEDIHDKLVKYDPKFFGNPGKGQEYRNKVIAWANLPNTDNDYDQLYQIKSALSKQWAEEKGKPESKGLSITYYQVMRSILYDLCRCSFQLSDGKIQSDGDSRIVMETRWIKQYTETTPVAVFDRESKLYIQVGDDAEAFKRFSLVLGILNSYKQLAESEQAIKLYINAYLNLYDPATGRVYPSLSSMLNSRRNALSTPNLAQLAKFGGSAYVRGFFLADEAGYFEQCCAAADHVHSEVDEEEQVVVSADWSGVELVLIGDQSGDPAFAEVYAQRPHGDPHSGTAADLLEIPLVEFKLRPDAKQMRTNIGKKGNFGYWYSGGLGTVAKEMGLSSETMWEFVDRYRKRYAVGEEWRLGTIQTAREYGYVRLPDNHLRYRFESTYTWANYMRTKFAAYGSTVAKFGELVIKKVQTRSGNQAVNSMIQGTCATLIKRTLLRMEEMIILHGFNARFMYPVYDEVVYSVARSHAVKFMEVLWHVMCETHDDIVTRLKLDASMAVGLNYQAYHAVNNPKGQMELDEASKLPCLPEERWGQKLTNEERQTVVDYLFEEKVLEPA